MFLYKAPNPHPEIRPSIINRIFSYNYLAKWLGRSIIPSQLRQPLTSMEYENIRQNMAENYPDLLIERGEVHTYDGAILDTTVLTPSTVKDLPFGQRRLLSNLKAIADFYEESLPDFAYDAIHLNMTVVGFNYRGVNNSTSSPWFFEDLITDGIAQVQCLLDAGAQPNNILIDGESMGGGIGTMVASYFHDKNLKSISMELPFLCSFIRCSN